MMTTYWLSTHLKYRCRHAGACCGSGWPIPLEAQRVEGVQQAVADGRIAAAGPWLVPVADAPGDAVGLLAIGQSGRCVFHQHHRCAIHGALGHNALPSACQHFPRVCLIDPRGVFVTLSHFCPTAASLLFDEGPVSIVEGPPALPGRAEPEGLDAREAWPPLLNDGVLMDYESYGRWERYMISVLAGEHAKPSPESALVHLRADAAKNTELPCPRQLGALVLFGQVCGTVPVPLAWAEAPNEFDREWATRVQPTWPSWAPVVQRFLAAHAFGSWIAYQGRGLRSIVRGLEAAFAVLQVEAVRVCQTRDCVLDRASLHEAIRQADLLLRHYADRQAFADAMSVASTSAQRR